MISDSGESAYKENIQTLIRENTHFPASSVDFVRESPEMLGISRD